MKSLCSLPAIYSINIRVGLPTLSCRDTLSQIFSHSAQIFVVFSVLYIIYLAMSQLYKDGEGAQRIGLRADESGKTRSRSAAKTGILVYKGVFFVAATSDL